MVVLLDNKVMVHIGQVRRIWVENDTTHIMGEWGYLHKDLPATAFDLIAAQLQATGNLVDCRPGASPVTEAFVNGPMAGAQAPAAVVKPKAKPKAEPAAPVPPLNKDAVVASIIAMTKEKGGEVYTAWSHYLSERFNSKFGLAGLKDFDDAQVVSFNNKLVECFRDGKLYPWDVDSTYQQPNPFDDDDLKKDGGIPDDDDEGFGDASQNGPPELYDARLARIVVEMAEMSKENLASLVSTLEKGVAGKHLQTADPHKMMGADLDKVISKLDDWHTKGKLQPLSETAKARIVAITEPFAE